MWAVLEYDADGTLDGLALDEDGNIKTYDFKDPAEDSAKDLQISRVIEI